MSEQAPVIAVPDVTALGLLIASQYPDGTQCYVAAAKALYTLDVDANVTADGEFVVTPASGAPIAGVSQARWILTSTATNLNAVITPTVLAASANDYAPTGFQGASILRMNASTTGIDITGMAAPTSGLSRLVTIQHVGTSAANDLTLIHQSASSAIGNRFVLPAAADLVIPIGGSVTLRYDVTLTKWLVMSTAGVS